MRKPAKIFATLAYRVGDRIQMQSLPHWCGEIIRIEISVWGEVPLVSYCVRMDTPRKIHRYLGEEDMVLLREDKEASK